MNERIRSALFYGVAISSVLALFSVTTTWGEANLKAAHTIAGSYRITEGDCLKEGIFQLEQSGKYLTASILPAHATAEQTIAARKRPMLNATWAGQLESQGGTTIQFSGYIPKEVVNCIANPEVNLDIVLAGDRLEGTFANAQLQNLRITAQREATQESKMQH
jgi:hypothetical protein